MSGAFTYVGGAINLAKRRVPRTTRAPGATGKTIRPAAPSGLSASTGARPIPPVGKPGGSPSTRPAAADLHEKMVVLQQSHEALARQLGDMQRTHETFFQKVADFFEGKGKKGKDKDD